MTGGFTTGGFSGKAYARVRQRALRPAVLALLSMIMLPASGAAQMDHAGMSMMSTSGVLGISRTRDGSGTAWHPDEGPMYGLGRMSGAWELMLQGSVFLQYIREGSERGESQLGSINWVMGTARHRLAGGELTLRSMLSAEPFTIPGCGYPILLATGETCDGEPIHDAQHPHDLFMELAAQYQRPITDALAFELYGGPSGEPAVGPVAFMHRTSALTNLLAPISHHWLDATHISFGVVTAGLFGRKWKLEGSLFNGREPDEERLDFDMGALDSYASRFWWLPSERWALQISGARLVEAEAAHAPGEPRTDMTRYTTSATYHHPLSEDGSWASTAALGRNVEEGTSTNALILESSVALGERHSIFGRSEWSQKPGHDLGLETAELEALTFDVANFAVGYTRHLGAQRGWVPGIGARGSVSFLPEALEPVYGKRRPLGFALFLNVRPAIMSMDMDMPMGQVVLPSAAPTRVSDRSQPR